MTKDKKLRLPAIIQHGWHVLPHVMVDAYNEELKDKDGFIGDRASKGAFREILDRWRTEVGSKSKEDPFGDTPTYSLTKSQLDKYFESDDPVAAALVHTAVEEFAGELATVTTRFLQLEEWKDTEHIVIGGGLSGSHIGKLSVGRALILLKDRGFDIEMSATPITLTRPACWAASSSRLRGSSTGTTPSWPLTSAVPTSGSVSLNSR
jgi:hypothetical protein